MRPESRQRNCTAARRATGGVISMMTDRKLTFKHLERENKLRLSLLMDPKQP
jgi:hypothetical protein